MIITRKIILKLLKQKVSVFVIAFMLGLSNVILEETRMVNDTGIRTEQQEVIPDEDPLNTVHPF